jgi:hypothetical protein
MDVMTAPLQLNVGRQRVTNQVSPSEAGYVHSINNQMALIKKNLEQVVEYVENVTPEAIVFGLQPAFEESQRLVPVDTGKLKRSGFIETRRTAFGTAAAMGYGRYGKPTYAAFVHENLALRHASPTQAKFMETAILTKIDDFRRRVVFFLQKQTGVSSGGGG